MTLSYNYSVGVHIETINFLEKLPPILLLLLLGFSPIRHVYSIMAPCHVTLLEDAVTKLTTILKI